MDQVRRTFEQAFALEQRFAHHADLTVLQVAQPAVNDRRGGAGWYGTEVILLDQKAAQAAAGALPRNGHAVDAATNHQNVECRKGSRISERQCATHLFY